MDKLLVGLVVLIVSMGVSAEEWSLLTQSGGTKGYVDLKGGIREGNIIKIWTLRDSTKVQTRSWEGNTYTYTYLSVKNKFEINCINKNIRITDIKLYKSNMAVGDSFLTTKASHKWEKAPSNSVGEFLWDLTCPDN